MVAGQADQPIFDGIVMENRSGAWQTGRPPGIADNRKCAAAVGRAQEETYNITLRGLNYSRSLEIRRVYETVFDPLSPMQLVKYAEPLNRQICDISGAY